MMAGPCNGLWVLWDHAEIEKTNLILLESRIKRWGLVEQILSLYKVWCSWLEVIIVNVLWNIKTKYMSNSSIKVRWNRGLHYFENCWASLLFHKHTYWLVAYIILKAVVSAEFKLFHESYNAQNADLLQQNGNKNQGVLARSYLENSSNSVRLQNSLKVGC